MADPLLKKVSKNTVTAQVIDQLTDLIRSGTLSPGDKLPSERDMAENLGVSRPPLREALRALEYAGAIETRSGDGIYIKSDNSPMAASPLISRILNRYTLEDTIETRRIVETAVVRLAAERADADDFDTVRAILRDAEENIHNVAVFVDCDFIFHNAIAEMTRNFLLMEAVQVMRKMMDAFNSELLVERANREEVLRQHAAILDCLAARDADMAVAAMERHLSNVVHMEMQRREDE